MTTTPSNIPAEITSLLEMFQDDLNNIYQDELKQVILFGSHARGEANEESDIDLLVVLKSAQKDKKRHEKVIEKISDLCIDYGKLISCIYLTEERYKTEKSPLLLNIAREGIILC